MNNDDGPMSTEPVIRLVTEDDADGVLAIYVPIVRDTAISFETEPPPKTEMARRITSTLPERPWLVCESEGAVKGYAYAGAFRTRAAYRWSVEVSVYVGADHRQSGVGRALYESLFAVLTLQGFYRAYAAITLPNPASVSLHERLRFEPVGVYRSVGYKLGAWHDVGWWQRALKSGGSEPTEPLPLNRARQHERWNDALRSGLAAIRT